MRDWLVKLDPRARGQAKLTSNVETRGRPANPGSPIS
jgi:hypothetical protein